MSAPATALALVARPDAGPDRPWGSAREPGQTALLTGSATAFPPAELQADLWSDFFSHRYRAGRTARRVFEASGVRRRHAVANPRIEDISGWSTSQRMTRYQLEALPLALEAASGALAAAGLDPSEIGQLVVVSCTGYATPGLDVSLARALGLSPGVQRLVVGHVGCHGALPGLGAASDFVRQRGQAALLVCVELCTLHVQPAGEDLSQLVPEALFGDGAAAVVVEPGSGGHRRRVPGSAPGLAVVDLAALSDLSASDQMTWEVTDHGFKMGLSRLVPSVLAANVVPLVEDLLGRHGLGIGDVERWAVHPGGPRILDVVGDRLGLAPGALDESRWVLAEHGNCSSPTVLVVLEEIRRRHHLAPGSNAVVLAFGPGLTLWGALLRAAAQ